jgi:hypothetical protein
MKAISEPPHQLIERLPQHFLPTDDCGWGMKSVFPILNRISFAQRAARLVQSAAGLRLEKPALTMANRPLLIRARLEF